MNKYDHPDKLESERLYATWRVRATTAARQLPTNEYDDFVEAMAKVTHNWQRFSIVEIYMLMHELGLLYDRLGLRVSFPTGITFPGDES